MTDLVGANLGVVCDGRDNSAALTSLFAAITSGSRVTLPSGVCRFSGPLTLPGVDDVRLDAGGCVLTYTGSYLWCDLVTLGTSVGASGNWCSAAGWKISDFTIRSLTPMLAGAGLKLNDVCDSVIDNFTGDGNKRGNGNLFNGMHWDGGNSVTWNGGCARGKNAAFIVNGDFGQQFTDPTLAGGITLVQSGDGLVVGGNVGGLQVDQTNILENRRNVVIDNSQIGLANNQLFFGPHCTVDVTSGSPDQGFIVNDFGGPLSYLFYKGWIASSGGFGMGFGPGVKWQAQLDGATVLGNKGDGIIVLSTGVTLSVVGGRVQGNGGYGIHTVPGVSVTTSGVLFGGNGLGDMGVG